MKEEGASPQVGRNEVLGGDIYTMLFGPVGHCFWLLYPRREANRQELLSHFTVFMRKPSH